MTQVTLYTKPGCHLCESVEEVIRNVARHRAFELNVVNILDDPDAHKLYEYEIPVVLVNGKEIARHRLGHAELEAALA